MNNERRFIIEFNLVKITSKKVKCNVSVDYANLAKTIQNLHRQNAIITDIKPISPLLKLNSHQEILKKRRERKQLILKQNRKREYKGRKSLKLSYGRRNKINSSRHRHKKRSPSL